MNEAVPVFLKRLRIILLGGMARLLAALSTVTISILVVRTQSSELWGEVVPLMLILEFGFTIIGWGSLPYLVQQFSLHPGRMKNDWSKSVFSRMGPLLIFLIALPFLSLPVTIKSGLMVWAVGRFTYQCFEPIAQVERNFVFSILLEFSALLLMAIPILTLPPPISSQIIVWLFAVSMVWRAMVSILFYRQWISFSRPSWQYFHESFPFFLLAVSGMLQQRTDLYCVAWLLSDEETAVYQVYFNFLIFCQFLCSLLLSPFAKNIFRLSTASLRKLERNFLLAGIPLTLASILAVFVMVRYFYGFQISFLMYVLGYVYILMFYVYLLRNYEMGKAYRQSKVAMFGFLGSAVNFVLCLFMIRPYGMTGALVAGTSAQVFIAWLYRRETLQGNA